MTILAGLLVLLCALVVYRWDRAERATDYWRSQAIAWQASAASRAWQHDETYRQALVVVARREALLQMVRDVKEN